MTAAFLLLSNLIHVLYTEIELLCDLFLVFFRKKRGIDYTKVRSRYTKRGLDHTKVRSRYTKRGLDYTKAGMRRHEYCDFKMFTK